VGALRSAAKCARDRQEPGDATQLLEEAVRMEEKLNENGHGAGVRGIREELQETRETTSGEAGRLRIVQRKA
ncbi:MAG: hypothetical protein WCC27_20675, partial [Acidobacteriaceae bacterium]